MPNRQLTRDELQTLFRPLLEDVRGRLRSLSADDERLLFALRRKLAKELGYDERGKPMQRRQLKAGKRALQRGKCAICSELLPEKNVVLDRLEAKAGYTEANTRLICRSCD